MDAWTKIVADLQKQSQPVPVIEKTFLQKVWNIVFPGDEPHNYKGCDRCGY